MTPAHLKVCLRRFKRCLVGRATHQSPELCRWAERALQDESLIPHSEVSEKWLLEFAVELAELANDWANNPFTKVKL